MISVLIHLRDSVRNGVISCQAEIFLPYVFQLKRAARLSVPPNGYTARPKHDSFSYGKTSQRYQITRKLGKLDFLYFVGLVDGLLSRFYYLRDDKNLLCYKVKKF